MWTGERSTPSSARNVEASHVVERNPSCQTAGAFRRMAAAPPPSKRRSWPTEVDDSPKKAVSPAYTYQQFQGQGRIRPGSRRAGARSRFIDLDSVEGLTLVSPATPRAFLPFKRARRSPSHTMNLNPRDFPLSGRLDQAVEIYRNIVACNDRIARSNDIHALTAAVMLPCYRTQFERLARQLTADEEQELHLALARFSSSKGSAAPVISPIDT